MRLSVTIDSSVSLKVMPLIDAIEHSHPDWTVKVFAARVGLTSPLPLPFMILHSADLEIRRYGEDAILSLGELAENQK